jgi:glycosyltransferase involved in cell wall biosynthesis
MGQGRPKVVRIITRLNVGGPSIQAILLTAELDGFESVLVCGTPGEAEGDMAYLAEALGVRPVVVPALGRELSALDDLRALWQLVGVLRRERPALVHTHMAKAGTLGRVAALLAGVPHRVHTFHGHVFHGYFSPLKSWLFLLIEQVLARLTDRIVAISPAQRSDLTSRYRVARGDRVELVELGFDLTPFARAGEARGRLRAELGVDERTRLVGMVGRMVPIKDYPLFIDAMAALVAARPELGDPGALRLVLVGGGELETEIRARVADAGLGGRTHFLGWRRDVAAIYADLDVVALTSKNEGTPVALIEAMATGTAICAVDVGGVADVLDGGRLGRLVRERTPEAFARAVGELLAGDEARRRLGALGREAALARYGAERLRRDIAGLYRRLLAGG